MLFMLVVVFASFIWVYSDATENKIGRSPSNNGLFNTSAGMWAFGTLILWIVVFPTYLIKRGSLIEVAKESPVEIKGRTIKLTLISFMSLYIFFSVFLSHVARAAAYQSDVDKASSSQGYAGVDSESDQLTTKQSSAGLVGEWLCTPSYIYYSGDDFEADNSLAQQAFTGDYTLSMNRDHTSTEEYSDGSGSTGGSWSEGNRTSFVGPKGNKQKILSITNNRLVFMRDKEAVTFLSDKGKYVGYGADCIR